MISFSLTCDNDHRFDSWFQSAAAFDVLAQKGHLSCAVCGSTKISKGLMAPRVSTKDTPPPEAIQKMRHHVETTSDYVGTGFAKAARDMHVGDAPERAIYGEATHDEVRSLLADDIPVMPLPFMPRKRTN